jgi:hypothetical protein
LGVAAAAAAAGGRGGCGGGGLGELSSPDDAGDGGCGAGRGCGANGFLEEAGCEPGEYGGGGSLLLGSSTAETSAA